MKTYDGNASFYNKNILAFGRRVDRLASIEWSDRSVVGERWPDYLYENKLASP